MVTETLFSKLRRFIWITLVWVTIFGRHGRLAENNIELSKDLTDNASHLLVLP